jgi:hypothetical protein
MGAALDNHLIDTDPDAEGQAVPAGRRGSPRSQVSTSGSELASDGAGSGVLSQLWRSAG